MFGFRLWDLARAAVGAIIEEALRRTEARRRAEAAADRAELAAARAQAAAERLAAENGWGEK